MSGKKLDLLYVGAFVDKSKKFSELFKIIRKNKTFKRIRIFTQNQFFTKKHFSYSVVFNIILITINRRDLKHSTIIQIIILYVQ